MFYKDIPLHHNNKQIEIMTYEDCLKKLDEIGFKDIFIKDFEA